MNYILILLTVNRDTPKKDAIKHLYRVFLFCTLTYYDKKKSYIHNILQ